MIVKIEHIRCGEFSAYTYVWAPDDWTEDIIYKKLGEAEAAYMAAIQEQKENEEPPNDARWGTPRYENYPDKTVKEVQEIYAREREEYKAWNEKRMAGYKRFGSFLQYVGFENLEHHVDQEVNIDWGHRHGTHLDYEDTRLDTSKTVRKAAGIKDELRFL